MSLIVNPRATDFCLQPLVRLISKQVVYKMASSELLKLNSLADKSFLYKVTRVTRTFYVETPAGEYWHHMMLEPSLKWTRLMRLIDFRRNHYVRDRDEAKALKC